MESCRKRLSGDPISVAPKIFVYTLWYKQKNRILFFQKAVYRFATHCQDTVGFFARNKLGWRHAWILWDPLFEVSRRTAETPGRRQRCLGALEPNHMLVDRERRPTHPIELDPRAFVMFQKSPFCPGTLPRTLKRSSCTAGVRSYGSEHGRSAQRCRCGSMRER